MCPHAVRNTQHRCVEAPVSRVLIGIGTEHGSERTVETLAFPVALEVVDRSEGVWHPEDLTKLLEEVRDEIRPVIVQKGIGGTVVEHQVLYGGDGNVV